MNEGADAGATVDIRDSRDEPMNAVIQIDFNEAVMPIQLSGDAEDLQFYIRVVCLSGDCDSATDEFFTCGDETCVSGTFEISNQYRTVEFLSNNQCGVNACGEPIYCLPANSNLQVELVAADLESCADAICTARTPYRDCSDEDEDVGHCQDSSDPRVNFPLSDIDTLDGVMDVALNSLDGNRNDNAQGPASFFNQNDGNQGNGDSFLWSFFINGEIETDPPHINSTNPAINSDNTHLTQPVIVEFDKLMMSSSLKSGSIIIDNGQTREVHKRMNIWNFANFPLGYWMAKENIDDSVPPDANPDHTDAEIRHTPFAENLDLRAQAGSGVKDIYQNCFKPGEGPACEGTYNSCCSGEESDDPSCE